MSKIFCATRSGEASYRTQDEAITLAKKRGDGLVIPYGTDTRFLHKIATKVLIEPDEGLTQMGDFLLLMAKERATE